MDHGQCKHFNGSQNKLCSRGVAYVQFEPGIPCIKWYGISAKGGTYLAPGEEPVERKPWRYAGKPCPFYEEPTNEDVQADRRKTEDAMNRTLAAFGVAAQWRTRPKPDADRREVVECPVCHGKLHLLQSSYNGHVHGRCETEGCVSWME